MTSQERHNTAPHHGYTTPDPMTKRVEEVVEEFERLSLNDKVLAHYNGWLRTTLTQLIMEVRGEQQREAVLTELRWLEQTIRDEGKPFIQHRIDALTPTDLPDNK